MSNNLLRPALIAAFGAMLSFPMLASASVVTNSMTTASADVSMTKTATDTLAAGKTASDGVDTKTASKTAQLEQFKASTGVLTGMRVTLNSTLTQTTHVTAAANAVTGNNGSVTAEGTGRSTVQVAVPDASPASSTLEVGDSCKNNRKEGCTGQATVTAPKRYDFNTPSGALSQYVGNGTFGVDYSASVTADTTANPFSGLATTTSTLDWAGTLSATYDYLLHAAQSFDGGSALSLDLDFGSVYLGDSAADQLFSIFNADGKRVGLQLTGVSETGNGNGMFSTNLDTYGNIAAGGSQGFKASFLASQLGSFSTTYQLTLADLAPSGTHAANTLYSNYGLTLNLAGTVLARPVRNDVPEPATLMLLGLGAAAFSVSRKRKS